MNSILKILEADERGTVLPALLARLVEAYEANPQRAASVLRFRHLQGLQKDHSAVVPLEKEAALQDSKEASVDLIYQKLAHLPKDYLQVYDSLLSDWYAGNSWNLQDELNKDEVTSWDTDYELTVDELGERGELLENKHFRERLQREADDLDSNRTLKEAFAREFDIDPTLPSSDFLLRLYQLRNDKSRREFFESLRRPNESILWAKELIGRLPSVAERSREFDSHVIAEMNGYVPRELFLLFEQANLCRLLDLDIPCVLTCGTMIEELVEKEFPELWGQWQEKRTQMSWELKIQEITKRFPKYKDAEAILVNIMVNRHVAAHSPDVYVRSETERSESILRMTREVLKIFYEVARPQVERN